MIVTKKALVTALAAALVTTLGACGGGSGGNLPPHTGAPQPASAQTKLGISVKALAGSSFPFALRRANSGTAASQSVSVTYNGSTVASGSLDGNGFAELTFTQDVPAGATVIVTIGSGATAIVASVTLATAISATASDVVYNAGPPPTISVTTRADNNGDGQVDPTDSEQQTETENPSDGNPENIDDQNDPVLPSNLPITIATCGSTLTLAPVTGQTGLGIDFQEKVEDSDTNAEFAYQSATFDGPLTFPIISTAARVDLTITQNGQELFSLEAPLGAITGTGTSSPAPSASPSAAPSASPSAVQSASASPTASPVGCPPLSPTARPNPSSSPS